MRSSAARRIFMIRFNSSETGGATFGTFKGFIRDWSFGALNPDDPQEVQPTIRIVGPITLTATMPVPTVAGPQGTDELRRKSDELAKRRAALDAEAAKLRAQLDNEAIAA